MAGKLKSYIKAFGILLVTVLFLSMIIVGGYRKSNQGQPIEFGISFSAKHAEELGLNTKETYEYLLSNLKFQNIRLMSYWDMHEVNRDEYNFELLDWMIKRAEQEGKNITLSVGMRQPRWPECHIPSWVNELSNEERNSELLDYIETTVNRYKDNSAITSYQLENEAANRLFGDCPKLSRELLLKEYKLIKSLSPDKQIILNVSNQSGIPLREPRTEKVGFSMYEHAYFSISEGGKQYKWSYWYLIPSWHSLRAGLIEILYANDTFVHELQAEPWGMKATVELSNETQLKLMNTDKLIEQVEYAKSTGMNEIYLWGAEWWYWRLINYNDDSFINTANKLFTQQNTSL